MNKTISTVDEFPFKQLFSKLIVESRNKLIFVVGKQNNFSNIAFNQKGILAGKIDYLIRKSKFTTIHIILFH